MRIRDDHQLNTFTGGHHVRISGFDFALSSRGPVRALADPGRAVILEKNRSRPGENRRKEMSP